MAEFEACFPACKGCAAAKFVDGRNVCRPGVFLLKVRGKSYNPPGKCPRKGKFEPGESGVSGYSSVVSNLIDKAVKFNATDDLDRMKQYIPRPDE